MPLSGPVQAVAFDLDNTLWDVDPVLVRAEQLWVDWLREHCPRIPERLSIADMRAARFALAAREPHNAHDMTYLRIASLAQHARDFGYDEAIAEQAFEIFIAARNEIELFADVRPALDRLAAHGYVLATFSNGNADLERIGIGHYFAASLNARSVGAAKPDPRCFQRLAAALGLPPAAVLYVGDDPVLDVQAAHAAGMPTAWINRTSQTWPTGMQPADLEVTDCAQLAAALGA